MDEFTHYNESGRARMVDISEKTETSRSATAQSIVHLSDELYEAIEKQQLKKGDPLQTAQLAGIMGAKKTSDIIPMCHPIALQGTDLEFAYQQAEEGWELHIRATVKCKGNTGVEMEALTAATTAALTFYDMCKAVDKGMIIKETKLLRKTGGKSGDYQAR
ncbi:cyclic pyranopterin monophosphate synthase subunit MoaC [Sinobaca qinghaiensis]|uniref:Cyclic pyranopterin monophosphate synthase n=1 Tax=Sinobaca qinghaiensis TaxID=342944 RepID=A0A419V4F9_9BACL|nr:cyclic pyranopterin monophosphate synthase MoaC [Sinobaca qinghaiensis]RKD73409.1 cyclic pyranopterin monophosphate synthase subunit MoaC [Sinobaca qinghaiensis]